MKPEPDVHIVGMEVRGQRARFKRVLSDQEFEEIAAHGLPGGMWAWHMAESAYRNGREHWHGPSSSPETPLATLSLYDQIMRLPVIVARFSAGIGCTVIAAESEYLSAYRPTENLDPLTYLHDAEWRSWNELAHWHEKLPRTSGKLRWKVAQVGGKALPDSFLREVNILSTKTEARKRLNQVVRQWRNQRPWGKYTATQDRFQRTLTVYEVSPRGEPLQFAASDGTLPIYDLKMRRSGHPEIQWSITIYPEGQEA